MSFLDKIEAGAERIRAESAVSTPAPTGVSIHHGFRRARPPVTVQPLIQTEAVDTAPETAQEPAAIPAAVTTHQEPQSTPSRFAGPDDLDRIIPLLEAAIEIDIDLETTHLTPWSPPKAAGKSQKLGTGETVTRYLINRPDCTINETPRARIIAIETDNGLVEAIDLDLLDHDQKCRLIAALARPEAVWVGHNLGFDSQWLNHILPGAKPGRIIDTMLMVTALKSDIEFDTIRTVVNNPGTDDEIIKQMRAAILKRAGRAAASGKNNDDAGAVSLDLLAMHFLNQKLDKEFQAPQNWMPSILSDGHLKYVLSDIRSPKLIARRMLGLADNSPISDVLEKIDSIPGGEAYRIFERAIPRLVQMQHTGIRIDPIEAADYRNALTQELNESVDKLIELSPELIGPFSEQLRNPNYGLTDELKTAIAAAFEQSTGKAICLTPENKPKLAAKDLILHYDNAPIVQAWLAAQKPGKTITMLDDYVARRDLYDRLHSLISIGTITGRTSSQEPNLQNMPRAERFRKLFKARSGYKIIATDYSAVEMLIAACLALRAYSQIVRSDFKLPKWVIKSAPPAFYDIMSAIRSGRPAINLVPENWPLPEPDFNNSAGPEAYGAYYASRFATALARLQNNGCNLKSDFNSLLDDRARMPLAGAFQRKLDPHLITGIQTEFRAGRFDLGDSINAFQFVEKLDDEKRKLLKSEMKKPRTAAKALNFGLIYGMSAGGLHNSGITNYNLGWTIEEAISAKAAWFELYPEIDLWHVFLKVLEINEKRPVRKNGGIFSDSSAKLFRHKTLSGRPVCGIKAGDAANYSDQGTGAEIALAAIANMPDWLAERFVNFVHDELLFEVEDDLVNAAVVEIEQVMNASGNRLFERYGVPSSVESAVGEHWIH